jgi:hypothetical protein
VAHLLVVNPLYVEGIHQLAFSQTASILNWLIGDS